MGATSGTIKMRVVYGGFLKYFKIFLDYFQKSIAILCGCGIIRV